MKFDVYFHNDFDGRASAAVFLDFLEKRGDTVENYFQMDHWIGGRWDAVVRKSTNSVAIFDFYFHPKATFFFDHHTTTFRKKEWEKNFRPSRFHNLNTKCKSCCRLVYDSLRKNFGYQPVKYIKDLAEWADVVDGALYTSPKQTIELKEAAFQIDAFIDARSKGSSLAWLIKLMSERAVGRISRLGKIQRVVKQIRVKINRAVDFTRKNLQIYDQVAFLDLTKSRLPRVRFAPHYLYPKLVYVVTFMKDADGFRIAIGGNPWRKSSSAIDLGKLAQGKYGGGGHQRAAGITGIRDRKTAMKIVGELIQVLNK